MKEQRMWAVITIHGFICTTGYTRKVAIWSFINHNREAQKKNRGWKWCYKTGYRCVRVTVREVEK